MNWVRNGPEKGIDDSQLELRCEGWKAQQAFCSGAQKAAPAEKWRWLKEQW
jgi:hypothetical protein